MHSNFRIVSHTEHSQVWTPPPTMLGRLSDGRHAWTEHVARVHTLHLADEPFIFAWDRGIAVGFPKFRVRQLATWTDLTEINAALELRPGSYIVEAFPIGWCGARKPRPVAIYRGDDLANWRELAWFDAHTSCALRAISTDLGDLDVDVVVVESLVDAAIAWGLPRDPHIPDVIVIDPALARRTGRRGMALVERGDMTITDVDPAVVVAAAYNTLGPRRLADVVGITIDEAKKLKRRHPRSAKVSRIVRGMPQDPHGLVAFAEKVAETARRCAFDGCTETIAARCRYCSMHAKTVRREKDRARKRVARAGKAMS
jgi:hypothetical protein